MVPANEFGAVLAYLRDHYHEPITNHQLARLAHLSVHLHERKLHLQAIYRNEFLIGRAYGNYLGLGELQAYPALRPLEKLFGHPHPGVRRGVMRALRPVSDSPFTGKETRSTSCSTASR